MKRFLLGALLALAALTASGQGVNVGAMNATSGAVRADNGPGQNLVDYNAVQPQGTVFAAPPTSSGAPTFQVLADGHGVILGQGTTPGTAQTLSNNFNINGKGIAANFEIPSTGCFQVTSLGKMCGTSTDGLFVFQTNAGNNTAKLSSGNSGSGSMLSFGGSGLITTATGNGGANGIMASGGYRFVQPAAQTTSFTFATNQSFVRCDATSGAVTGTLPSAAVNGQDYIFVKLDTSANACILQRGSSNTIDGQTSISLLNQGDWIEVVDGTTIGNWTIVGGNYFYKTCQNMFSANNAEMQFCSASEATAISTGGATTDTTANLLPANALIMGVESRVTVTINGPSTVSVGDATTAARFSAAAGSLFTAGATRHSMDMWSGAVTTLAAGPSQAAAAKVRYTFNSTPSTGTMRTTVWYIVFTPPTS